MHLRGTRATMATLINRFVLDPTSRLIANAASRSQISSTSRCYSHYRPIYSVCPVQTRSANTSSGSFAPSTMADSRRLKSCNMQANLSVCEDSDNLPPLPVPGLHDTVEKLKESISPVAMNSTEFVNTLQLVDEFAEKVGPKLDVFLNSKAERTKNWLAHDWWIQETYLKSRKPLVINSNPAMIYPSFPFEVTNQRTLVDFTSHLISSIIDFKLALARGYNPEASSTDEEYRLDPHICYNQYKYLFGSTRLPGHQLDSLNLKQIESDYPNDSEPFNIVISHREKFYQLQLRGVTDEKGRIEKISSILDKIISSSTGSADESHPIGAGVLTTAPRDEWAKTFKLLDEASMVAIQEAEFLVCLDTIPCDREKFSTALLAQPQGSCHHSEALGRQVLHSDSANVGNRWFDKALQLIVVGDENAQRFLGAGLNFEHSSAEGTPIVKLLEYSYDKTNQSYSNSLKTPNFFAEQQVQTQEPSVFRQLRMFNEENMSEILHQLKRTKEDFIAHVDQFDLSLLDFKHYGKNTIKSWHFSPDSWFQVAMQLGYYNIHKRFGPCYESASTRKFAYGRTETIRSLTKEVAQFCLDPKYETMQAAVQSHKAYALSAGRGQAIDRVLLGYRAIFSEIRNRSWKWGLPSSDEARAILSNIKTEQDFGLEDVFSEEELNIISAFFNNDLIKRSQKFALSTSQVSSVHPDIYMSYGPFLADGYGCCYNITGQKIVAAITANSSYQSFSCEVHELNESIQKSLNMMSGILEEKRLKGQHKS